MKKTYMLFALSLALVIPFFLNNSVSSLKAEETDYVVSLKNDTDEWKNNAGNQVASSTSKGIKWTNFNGKSDFATAMYKEKVCLDGLSLTVYDDARNTPESGKEFVGFYFNGVKEVARTDYDINLTFGIDPYKKDAQTRVMVGSSSTINTSGQAYKGNPCCYSSMQSDAKVGLCAKTCVIIKNGMTEYDAINFSFKKMNEEFYKVEITDVNQYGWKHGDNAPYNEDGDVVTTYIKTSDILNYSNDGLVYLYALASSPSSSAYKDAVICGIDDLKRTIPGDKMTQIKTNIDTFISQCITGKTSSDYQTAKEYLVDTLTPLDRVVLASKDEYSGAYETIKNWATLNGDTLVIKLANGRILFEEELETLTFKNGSHANLIIESKSSFTKIKIDGVEVPNTMIVTKDSVKSISFKYLNTLKVGKYKLELLNEEVIDKYYLEIVENDEKYLPYTSKFEIEVNSNNLGDITFPIDINGASLEELTIKIDERVLNSNKFEFKEYNTIFVLYKSVFESLTTGVHYLYMTRNGVDGYFDIQITKVNQEPEVKKGCGGSIETYSFIAISVTLLSLICLKKKKESI